MLWKRRDPAARSISLASSASPRRSVDSPATVLRPRRRGDRELADVRVLHQAGSASRARGGGLVRWYKSAVTAHRHRRPPHISGVPLVVLWAGSRRSNAQFSDEAPIS